MPDSTDSFNASFPGSETNPRPLIEIYPPADGTANRRAIVIFPGGGYQHLAPHEGKGYAEYFAAAGYTCFVVTYRLATDGHRHPAMLEDAVAAVHSVRQKAAKFGIDPDKIGVMGSSAGGHLAASLMVHNARYADRANGRPDFGILCYPVITFGPEFAHSGSRTALLGDNPDPAMVDFLSCEKQVTPTTPPAFLWHTGEDTSVPMQNSLLFADAVHRADVPVELHVYPDGRHGLGLNTPFGWALEALRFIDDRFN
jgi:acetyl esterase/lipase